MDILTYQKVLEAIDAVEGTKRTYSDAAITPQKMAKVYNTGKVADFPLGYWGLKQNFQIGAAGNAKATIFRKKLANGKIFVLTADINGVYSSLLSADDNGISRIGNENVVVLKQQAGTLVTTIANYATRVYKLSDTNYAIVWYECLTGNVYNYYAMAFSLDTTTGLITPGAVTSMGTNTGTTSWMCSCNVNAANNKIIVVYASAAASVYRVLTISGTTITATAQASFSTPVPVSYTYHNYLRMFYLSDDKVLVTYPYNSTAYTYGTLVFSGTAFTPYLTASISTANATYYTSLEVFVPEGSANIILISKYVDSGNQVYQVRGIILNIPAGNIPTAVSAQLTIAPMYTPTESCYGIIPMSPTKFAVIASAGSANTLNINYVTYSGNTLGMVTVAISTGYCYGWAAYDTNKLMLLIHGTAATPYKLRAHTFQLDDAGLVFNAINSVPSVLDLGVTLPVSNGIVQFEGEFTPEVSMIWVGNRVVFIGDVVNQVALLIDKDEVVNYTSDKPLGVAENGTDVRLKGIVKGLSGLIPGNQYYYDKYGTITNVNTAIDGTNAVSLGLAITDTELLIKDWLI